jgi:hypothetical protein
MDESGFTPELTAEIVKRLGKDDDLDDIIMDTCGITHLSWEEAEKRIRSIQESYAVRITEKQFPLLTGIALFTFFVGLIILTYGIYTILAPAMNQGEFAPKDITSYFLPILERGTDPFTAFQPAFFPYLNLFVGILFSPLAAILFGIAMVTGSLVGMKDTWSILLNHQPA